MRRSSLALLALCAACAPSKGAEPRTDSELGSSASAVASVATSEHTRELGPGASATPPVALPPTMPLELPKGALFAYREGGVALAFTPPRRVTMLGSVDKPCSYELGEGGNMYSGAEIEAAWRNAEAASAVAKSQSFLPPDDLALGSEVLGADGKIQWTPFCGGLCIQGPPGVVSLLRVLHVLATNARGVCSSAK